MKLIASFFAAFLLMVSTQVQAQDKYFTREGHVRFFSKAALEDIEANNYQVTSVVVPETGEMAFSMLMKGFKFKNALMQEHFNEKYVHSDKHPKAKFEGTWEGAVDMSTDGEYHVDVKGTMSLHGVDKEVTATGIFTVTDGGLSGTSTFNLTLADYDIKIPSAVKDNIAETVEITVKTSYNKMN
jgi:polyisoprenoid-binding protein YceI